jgi:hypothetical protein
VRSGSLTSPVSTTDGSDIELGSEDSSTNSGGDFGGALDSKSDMSSGISYGDECLETSTLTSRTLLLNGHDLHNLVLKLVLKEVVDNLSLLHGDTEKENLLDGTNLSLLHETTELGDGNPHVLVTASLATASPSAASATVSTSAASAAFSSSTSETSAFFAHFVIVFET